MAPIIPVASSRIASSAASGERLKVRGSISARIGLQPDRMMELTLAKKLKGVVMTSPGGRGFEAGDFRAEDEALRVADGGDGGEDFVAQRRVVAAKVEHRDGLELRILHRLSWYRVAGKQIPCGDDN
jgi:hypothetical protein